MPLPVIQFVAMSRPRRMAVSVARVVAIGLYWILTRALLLSALVFTTTFFVLNAGPFPAGLSAALHAALPGRIEMAGIQIGPIPWRVDLLGVRITTPSGEEVIRAGTVHVSLDLLPLVRYLLGRSEEIKVRLTSVRLSDFNVELVFPREGRLRLVDAFAPPPSPSPREDTGGNGTPVRVLFDRIMGERGAVTLCFPEWDLRITGISLDTDLRIADGVFMDTREVRFDGEVGHITLPRDIPVVPRQVPMKGGRVVGFKLRPDGIFIEHAHIAFEGMDLECGGRLDFPQDARPLAYSAWTQLHFPEGSPIVATGTADVVRGAVDLRVEGEGTYLVPSFSLTLASPRLSLLGRDLGAVQVAAFGSRDHGGAYVFKAPMVVVHPAGGEVRLSDMALYPFGPVRGESRPAEGGFKARWADLDTRALLAMFGVRPPERALPVRLGGSAEVKAVLGGEDGPSLWASVNVEGVPGQETILGAQAAALHLKVQAAFGGAGPVVRVQEARLQSGAGVVSARGVLDLKSRSVALVGTADLDLAPVLRGLGRAGSGKAFLTGIKVAGPISSPAMVAGLSVTGLALDPFVVDQARASLRVAQGMVAASDLSLSSPYGAVAARKLVLSVHRRLAVEGARVTGLDLARFPLTKGLKGKGDLWTERLSLDLSAPLATLTGDMSAAFSSLRVASRSLTKVILSLKAKAGDIEIEQASALVRGGGDVTASGSLNMQTRMADLKLALAGVPLSALAGGATGSLKGALDLNVSLFGRLEDPGVRARASVTGLAFGELKLSDVVVAAARDPGGDMMFSSERFLPKLTLRPESRLVWNGREFERLVVAVHAANLTPQDIFQSLRARDITGEMTGDLMVDLGLRGSQGFRARLESPPGGIVLRVMDRELALTSRGPLVVAVLPDGSVTVSGLVLDDGQHKLHACGTLSDPDGHLRMWVHGEAGLGWLRLLKRTFSMADGHVHLAGLPGDDEITAPMGCEGVSPPADGVMRVEGTITAPVIKGTITTGPIDLAVRSLSDAFHVQPFGKVLLKPAPGGGIQVEVPLDGTLRGTFGDGLFAVRGRAVFPGLAPPTSAEVHLNGTGLRIAVPGQFYAVVDSNVSLAAVGAQEVSISGEVHITDGSYYRNFDVLRKAFRGVAYGRVAEREGPSLAKVAPWLANATLDLALTGTHLGLRSRVPVGSTDLELGLDLAVRGTVASPELWNRVEVLPGGKVVYEVVHREFEVVRGTLDFRGDPTRPLLDLTARTRVRFRGNPAAQTISGGHAPETRSDPFEEDTVLVTLKLTGEYPNLDVSLSSNTSELDPTDLQYLLLTGMTRREAASGQTGAFSIPVLTDDMTGLAKQILLAPFVDVVRLGVSLTGAVNAEVAAHLGSRLKFETEVLREQGGGSRLAAGFQLKLTERLYLDGRVRAVDPSVARQNEQTRLFESKLRYRIPLD